MHIFIDEAGSFTYSAEPDVWSAIGALVVPDCSLGRAEQALIKFKAENGFTPDAEVKFKHITDGASYYRLLDALVDAHCTFFGMAADAHKSPPEAVQSTRHSFTQGATKYIGKMRHASGVATVNQIATQIAKLSDPLFVQFVCQVQLMHNVVAGAINYYSQWLPEELSSFTWRIDGKDPLKQTSYEDVFEKMSPVYLQTISLSNPITLIQGQGWDYTHLQQHLYQPGTAPSYLKDDYGIDAGGDGGLDIQGLFRKDIKFVNSKGCSGVQLADLLCSGLRKCLRGELQDNMRVAAGMGQLMLGQLRSEGMPPLLLLSMKDASPVEGAVVNVIWEMHKQQKPAVREWT